MKGTTSHSGETEVLKHPIKLDFLVCSDDGDEGLLSFDTLKELSIVWTEE